MPRPLSIKNQILARESDNGDGICGGLVLPSFDLFQSDQYRDRGDPGTAKANAASAATRRAGGLCGPAPLRSR
jgi:hypothetical protein